MDDRRRTMEDGQRETDDGRIVPRPSSLVSRRLLIRLVGLIVAVLCLLPVGGKYDLLPLVPALSSFVAVASILSWAIQPIVCLGLIAGLVALFRHRWFCRLVCPMGLCLDGASHVGRRLGRRPCQSMSIGRWLFALTLGGAILGYPLFLWCDPLALFAGLFLLAERDQMLTGAVSLLVVVLLLMFSVLRPDIWCRGVCPLGAFQDLLSKAFRASRSAPRRKATGRDTSGYSVARRTILGVMVGAAVTGILRIIDRNSARPLRPPGAVDELTFKGLCTRCGNCIRSCPYDIIRRDTGQHSVDGILTPLLTFDKDYCREDCNRCTQVCPSGALAAVDVGDKPNVQIGLARVDMELCLLGEDRECSACMRWCPYGAVRYVFSEAEYTLVPVIDADKCNGCGACETACPTSPLKAIRILADANVGRVSPKRNPQETGKVS